MRIAKDYLEESKGIRKVLIVEIKYTVVRIERENYGFGYLPHGVMYYITKAIESVKRQIQKDIVWQSRTIYRQLPYPRKKMTEERTQQWLLLQRDKYPYGMDDMEKEGK